MLRVNFKDFLQNCNTINCGVYAGLMSLVKNIVLGNKQETMPIYHHIEFYKNTVPFIFATYRI